MEQEQEHSGFGPVTTDLILEENLYLNPFALSQKSAVSPQIRFGYLSV